MSFDVWVFNVLGVIVVLKNWTVRPEITNYRISIQFLNFLSVKCCKTSLIEKKSSYKNSTVFAERETGSGSRFLGGSLYFFFKHVYSLWYFVIIIIFIIWWVCWICAFLIKFHPPSPSSSLWCTCFFNLANLCCGFCVFLAALVSTSKSLRRIFRPLCPVPILAWAWVSRFESLLDPFCTYTTLRSCFPVFIS